MSENSDSSAGEAQKKTFDLVDTLANSLGDVQQRLIVKVLLHTGIYLHELIWLRSDDIDLGSRSIRISKKTSHDRKERNIKMPDPLAHDLLRFSNTPRPYLFYSPFFPQLNEKYVQRILKKCSLSWNLNLTPRTLQQLYRQRQLSEKKGGASFGLKRFDEKRAVDKEHLRALFQRGDSRDKLILAILRESGCFASELLSLKKSHVDFLQNQITILGRRSRIIDITPGLGSRIYAYCEENRLDDGDYLLSRKRTPLGAARLAQILSDIGASRAKITARSLRYAAYSSFFKDLSMESRVYQSGLRHINRFHLFGALQENE